MRLLALFLVALVGCGDGDARPVQIQLLNRGSCSPPQYDLTCMRAIRVQMFSEEQSYRAKCTQVAPAFATWQELVSSRKTDFLLEEIRARKDVRIEIRGYHNRGGGDPCASLDDSRLMLWGTSDVVDLSDPDTETINIPVDCRPKCDCRFMDDMVCPEELEHGVCAPPVRRECRNYACDTDDTECFDGQMQCTGGTCSPWTASSVCAFCESSSECDSELCVHHTYDRDVTVDEKFCADETRCPPLEGRAHSCPQGMQCTKLGAGAYVGGGFELLP